MVFKKTKPIQLNLPKNYAESQYLNRLPYLSNKNKPDVDNQILNAAKNRKDLQKWLIATSDIGQEIQEDVNAIVEGDEKFNNTVARRTLDLKNDGVYQNPEPLTVVFRDVKKFDTQNSIIGKLATQIKASKLTEEQLTNNILMRDQIADIENRLPELKKRDNNDGKGSGGSGVSGGGGGGGPPVGGSAPPFREAEMDPFFRRPPGLPPPPPERNEYRSLMERLDQLCRRPVPQPREPQPFADLGDVFDAFEDPTDTLKDKTERLKHDPREEVSLDDLPDVPQTIPIIDTFSRPLTRITPKTKEIEERNLSEQLQKLFPDIDQKVNEKEKDFQLDIENLSQVLSEIEKSEIVPFEFEFFHGGQN